MSALSDFTERVAAYFHGPFLRAGSDHSLTIPSDPHSPYFKQFRFEIVANVNEGYHHYAVAIPALGIEWFELVKPSGLKAFAKQLTSGVHVQWGQSSELPSSLDTLANSAFTKQVYIFTDALTIEKGAVVQALGMRGMKAVIINDALWNERNSLRKCDVFLSHDSRDKERFVRDLHTELIKRHIKVWYDEATLRPGDQLGSSIDGGLTECRHGIIILSSNLLTNQGWGQTEMSALLTRAATTKQVIIPVWLDVTKDQVAARSARLADLVAIDAKDGPSTVANKIVATIGGPKGLRR